MLTLDQHPSFNRKCANSRDFCEEKLDGVKLACEKWLSSNTIWQKMYTWFVEESRHYPLCI